MPTGGRAAKRPVTVVTGFLGSGKTTLLSGVLSAPSMRNTVVLVNEFGEVGLDHHLLRRTNERTVLLGSGCVCCTTREDLAEALMQLLEMEDRGEVTPLERVVVETTGLADPSPILFTVFSDPVLQHHFFVDLVVATADAVNGLLHLDRNPESVKQVAAADRVVVTKTDIAEPATTRDLVRRLRAINPSADVVEASFGEVDPEGLLRPTAGPGPGAGRGADVGRDAADEHDVAETHSVSLTFDGPVDWAAFGVWLSMLLHARGEYVLRVKGLLDVGGPGPVVLNGVQHVIHPPEHLGSWPDADRRSRVVLITKRIPAREILLSLRAFRSLLGAAPRPLEAEPARTL